MRIAEWRAQGAGDGTPSETGDETGETGDMSNEVVLPNFRYAMVVGPVNWEKRPTLPPVARTRKANFTRP